jgi:NDP-sugar pyrophosphorylase family protein
VRTRALIMAGGTGRRMRASGVSSPKPLVSVRGVPLVERNLLALLGAGFRDVAVSIPLGHRGLAFWIEQRGKPIAQALGGRLEPIQERRPLDSMGAAALLQDRCESLLIVFADNLTTLDPWALVSRHDESGAALTLATHDQPFRIPYGVPRVAGDRVLSFDEKPVISLLVCSGLYVIGPTALAVMKAGEPIGAPALLKRLLTSDSAAPVLRFHHSAPWIDVNDGWAVLRAEELVAAQPALECWAPRVNRERANVLLGHEGRWLVERSSAAGDGVWELPGVWLEPGRNPAEALRAAGVLEPIRDLALCAVFDDVDLSTGDIVRHHLLRASYHSAAPPDGTQWIDAVHTEALPLRWSTQRALACLRSAGGGEAVRRESPQIDRFTE